MKRSSRPVCVAVGGLDPSGGAGILMDVRAMQRAGAWGSAVATMVTVQSTRGLVRVEAIAPALVRAQLLELLGDVKVRVVKTGALGDAAIVRVLLEVMRGHPSVKWVIDPVLSPTKGKVRLGPSVEALRPLLERADLVTPNVPEAAAILGSTIATASQARDAARELQRTTRAVLLKGGHLDDGSRWVVDWLAVKGRVLPLRHARRGGGDVHGTGCALASLIAGRMAAKLPGDVETSVRWSIDKLGRWLRSADRIGRGMRVLLAIALCLVATNAQAQPTPKDAPKPPAKEAPKACDAACVMPISALATVARALSAGLARIPDGTVLAIAPLESDEPAPKGDALADAIASLVAGRLGSGVKVVGRMSLADARARAKRDAPSTVYLTPKIAGGRLVVAADVYAIPRSVWARARGSVASGPVGHVMAQSLLDAEIRTYLDPIGFDKAPKVTQYDGADPDMLDLACGDLDGDGSSELLTLSRSRVLAVALRDGKVERLREARWGGLLPIAPAPLRQPIGFATIVEGPNASRRSGYVDVSITDRAGSARLDSQLGLIETMEGTALPHGRATACSWISNLLLGEKLLACTAREPAPAVADLKHRADAMESAHVIARDGSGATLAALRSDSTLIVRGKDGEKVIARVGAQLAIGDIDQDGAPEVVSTMDVLSPKFDAVEVRTLHATGEPTRRYRLPVTTGVEALALCPHDGRGRAPIVLASQGKLWVLR